MGGHLHLINAGGNRVDTPMNTCGGDGPGGPDPLITPGGVVG